MRQLIVKTIDILNVLGPGWIVERVMNQFELRSGHLKTKTPCRGWTYSAPDIVGNFFYHFIQTPVNNIDVSKAAEEILHGKFRFFFHRQFNYSIPPDWFTNPFHDLTDSESLQHIHWSRLSDFEHGDIKGIWELSRFAWVYPLVRAYHCDKQNRIADFFGRLIEDWAYFNPPNSGVHWKCGQEIAVRMLAIVTGYFGFQYNDTKHVDDLRRKQLIEEIIFESARRIEANINYALSQKNNHGISEAAGLFTAGVLFNRQNWRDKGGRLLENQVQNLIYNDGSFSQHSANYHRVMLHVCLWAIQLGRANGFEFSDNFITRIKKAGKWLLSLYDSKTGRMPNLGSNDGALVLPYSRCEYHDYRPTIQATAAVIEDKKWLPSGEWDDLALWLVPEWKKLDQPHAFKRKNVFDSLERAVLQKKTVQLTMLHDGGYAVFTHGSTKLIFRCPTQFFHRPAHCDLLHIDLWHNGVNVLRDSGTYSYNCEQPWQDYFKSVAAHNTIQFDNHDQMPKISRFLFGKWPRLNVKWKSEGLVPSVMAEFYDWKGCFHKRTVEVTKKNIRVVDIVSGYTENAVLRWRLLPDVVWKLSEMACHSIHCSLRIQSDAGLEQIKLTEGRESLYYQNKSVLPVLEASFDLPCREIITEIELTKK